MSSVAICVKIHAMSASIRQYSPQTEEIRKAFEELLCGYYSGDFGESGLELRLVAIEARIAVLEATKIDTCKSIAMSIVL